MGGNYFPDTDTGEVEIARISQESFTCDVTCVYACMRKGLILYRVVDENEGETLSKPKTRRTKLPMKLGQLTDYSLKTWPLITVLDLNGFDTVESGLAFLTAESDFYPEFARLYEERVRAYYGRASHERQGYT